MALIGYVLIGLVPLSVFLILRNVYIFISWHDHGEAYGCKPLKIIPNSWLLPFGIDKLKKSLTAERKRKFPTLMLSDHEFFGDNYGQYAGGQFIILTRDPRNISAVLSKQFADFEYGPVRHGCFSPLLGSGIFTNDGPEWTTSRRLLAPIFHGRHLPHLETLEQHIQSFFAAIRKSMDHGSPVDLKPLIYSFTLDTATEFFLGKSTDMLSQSEADPQNEKARTFFKAFNTALEYLATRERFKAFYWLVNPAEFRAACRTARGALEDMIKDSLRSSDEIKARSALQSIYEKMGEDLDKTRDEVYNILFAGRDSSASLLCWIFYSLAREPGVCRKLRREVIEKLGDGSDRPVTEKDLAEMTYLDNVISETLRLFPAVPLNGRVCARTTKLPVGGGVKGEDPIHVPKGTLICYSTYALQRSEGIYGKTAGQFIPERWEEESIVARTRDWTFHPFSGGPRKCLGENYALKLVKYTMCRFIQQFSNIEAIDHSAGSTEDWQEEIKYQIGLTMAPDDGVWTKLTLS
ncbi:cytochrome P450 CYP5202A1 [Phyllosticta citrichinensis]